MESICFCDPMKSSGRDWKDVYKYVPLSGSSLLLFMVINNDKHEDCARTQEVVVRTPGLDSEALLQVPISSYMVLNR